MSQHPKPFVPPEESLPELTAKALLLGVVVAAFLGAANAYLGFKAGQTVSATFPAAVLAIAAFRLPFFRGSVLEQNTMRTAASVGEALAAGAIFTVPAFVMVNVGGQRLWTSFSYWETSLILLVGGLLGILFIILLRRTLAVDAGLPFPESRACAEIVKTGQSGDTGARYVFGAMGLGMLIQVFKDPAGIRLFQESVQLVKELPASIVHHMDSGRAPLGDVTHKGALVAATPSISPALIGVGYIIGFELAAINFAGGVLAWLVLVPLALFLNPGLPQLLAGPRGRRPSPRSSSPSGTTRSGRSRWARCWSAPPARCGGCGARSARPSGGRCTAGAPPSRCARRRTCPRAPCSRGSSPSPCRSS